MVFSTEILSRTMADSLSKLCFIVDNSLSILLNSPSCSTDTKTSL